MNRSTKDELQATIADMVVPCKGILAADESAPTIAKRFAAIGVVYSRVAACLSLASVYYARY